MFYEHWSDLEYVTVCDEDNIEEFVPTRENGLWYYNSLRTPAECKGLDRLGKPC